jgi:hypothetical protein
MAQVVHLTPAVHMPPTAHVVLDGVSADTKTTLAKRMATQDNVFAMAAVLDSVSIDDAREITQMAIALGADPIIAANALEYSQNRRKTHRKIAIWWGILGTVSMAASAYHGYRRNRSIGWALAWGLAGAVFPVITPTIAVAQGFGKRKR